MKPKPYSLAALLISFAFATSANPTITFQKAYATAGPSETSAAIMPTFDGNYCIANGVGDNNGDLSLVKLDLNGDTLWTRLYGGNLREDFTSAMQTSDSGFILCGLTYSFSNGSSDAYVVKTDVNGNVLWSKSYGDFNSEEFYSIRQTADGGYIAAGATTSYGNGGNDIFLVKMNSTGVVTWSKTIGGPGDDFALSLRETYDKGYIISGFTNSFLASSGRIYLVKTDSLGVVAWSSIFGGVAGESGQSVRQCRDSGYIVTGYTNSFGTGTMDVFLLKATPSGGLSWMKTYGGSGMDNAYDVEQTADDGFIAVGFTESFFTTPASGEPVYLIKTNPSGDTLWTRAYSGGDVINNYGYAVKQVADKGYVVADCRFGFRLTKTDSLGMTPCMNSVAATVTTTASPKVTTGAFITSPTVVANNAATQTRYTTLTASVGCSGATPTGVNILSAVTANGSVYPNPFSDMLRVGVKGAGSCEFVMYDLMSQKIVQERFEDQKMVFTESLSPGIYFYELYNQGQLLKSGKLVKQ